MKTPGLDGFCDLMYQSPNNWENRIHKSVSIYLLWSDGRSWNSKKLNEMKYGDYFRVTTQNIEKDCLTTGLALIYPSIDQLDSKLVALPGKKVWFSEIPAWRNTSGFYNEHTQVSYQADIEPLPPRASLLTFHPFIQFGELSNFLLVLNAQVNPKIENHNLYIFNSKTKELIDEVKVQTNGVSLIGLDKYKFKQTDLPVFICPTMAAVPFGLGISSDTKGLSLEHTHPPGSFVVRGDRNKIQKQIKSEWFKALKIDTLS
jgi:hypothetical protein